MDPDFRIHHTSILSTDVKSLKRYLREDLGYGDLSSRVLIDGGMAEAEIISKEDCVLAGVEEVAVLFGMLKVPVWVLAEDGCKIGNQERVMRIKGDVRSILAAERLSLNILSRMSGIATLVNSLVERARELKPGIRIACTRKTTPGFRFFQKKAVIIGGGDPHRFRLDDCIMLKDNHLSRLDSIREGVKRAKEFSFTKKVEVEVEDLDSALEAADAGADIVMLDNMDPASAEKCYSSLKERYPSVIVEVSGGITPENILDYAEHADVISLGYLTHSYRAIDFSLEVLD